MARPHRKILKFDEDSVNKLLQEIYDETFNIRAKITRLFSKWETKVKETGEVAAIGEQIIKLIGAEAKNQDQKIMLLKYLKEVVFEKKSENNNNNSKSEENDVVTTDRRNQLLTWVQEEIEKKETVK